MAGRQVAAQVASAFAVPSASSGKHGAMHATDWQSVGVSATCTWVRMGVSSARGPPRTAPQCVYSSTAHTACAAPPLARAPSDRLVAGATHAREHAPRRARRRAPPPDAPAKIAGGAAALGSAARCALAVHKKKAI